MSKATQAGTLTAAEAVRRAVVSQAANGVCYASLGETALATSDMERMVAALPRAMAHLHDVRVLIPGYRQVLDSDNPIHIIGELGGHAALMLGLRPTSSVADALFAARPELPNWIGRFFPTLMVTIGHGALLLGARRTAGATARRYVKSPGVMRHLRAESSVQLVMEPDPKGDRA